MVNLILECIAVLMAILYLVLAAKEDVKCWYAALISSLIYIYIMYQANLFMESILQVFYVLMAIYGWLQWKNIINTNIVLNIKSWKKSNHFFAITIVLILSFISGATLEKYTQAALPFLDAFTTWGAIITTYMVAKKILEKHLHFRVSRIHYCQLGVLGIRVVKPGQLRVDFTAIIPAASDRATTRG